VIPTRAFALVFSVIAAFAQAPGLSGVWKAEGTAYLNRAEALAQVRKNFAARATADPEAKCYQPGVPRGMLLPYPLQIMQNARAVYIVHERVHAYRILYLDGSAHNDGLAYAMGDSRARWEGETLVADVTSFSDLTWLDAAGHHHSEGLHVVEKYRLTGPETMEYTATVEDGGVFTKPWTMRVMLRRQHGVELLEDVCAVGLTGGRRHVPPFRKK
jgi:hypothetical protein